MRIAINGARGRMGRILTDMLDEGAKHVIAALVEVPGHPGAGIPVMTRNGPVTLLDSPAAIPADIDIGIDFSAPGFCEPFARAMYDRGAALIVGTTGLDQAGRDVLAGLAERIPLLAAANLSLGVYCLTELTMAARRLLGDDYDVEIVEMHHRHKKDSPSGTALAIADELSATGLDVAISREGQRHDREAGVVSVRGGEVVGTHTIYFLGAHDQIEICHRASSRAVFARGAIILGECLAGSKPGLYDVRDLLR